MDFWGTVLVASLDRIAVIAAAAAIGYWGYRLYAAEKQMGLVFLGLAVVLVAGVLVTGSAHVRSLGDSIRMARAPIPEPVTAPLPPRAAPVPVSPGTPVDTVVEAIEPPAPPVNRVATVTPIEAPAVDADIEPDAEEDAPPPARAPRLATVEELGGRIMSIRSEGVSIEWSAPTN
jgi:hypothetical protein